MSASTAMATLEWAVNRNLRDFPGVRARRMEPKAAFEAGRTRILEGIAAQVPLATSLERIVRLHESLNPGALCSVLLLDAEGRHVLHGAAPSLPEAYNRAIHGEAIGEGRGSCGTAIHRRERVLVEDIATHPFWDDYREVALSHGLRACWSTPILGSQRQPLGSFAVYYREPRAPRPAELDSIESMRAVAAIAIESDRMLSRLRDAASFDVLTGLATRAAFEARLGTMLQGGAPCSVLLLGLDRFRTVNESLGHVIGDGVLAQMATRIRALVADGGIAARLAGDEFAVAVAGHGETMELAERMLRAIAEPIDREDFQLVVTTSIGVAFAPAHGTVPVDLLRRAEAAMTRAKRVGRNGVCVFSSRQIAEIEERLQLGHRLRGAAQRGHLQLHYQSIHRASDSAFTGFEALLRWTDPERGPVPPTTFIPIGEALGLMPEVGRWVIDAACRQARVWLDAGRDAFTISVNVSALQLLRGGLASDVSDALARHGLPPGVLGIEITESSLMENVERVRDTLVALKRLGTVLALDDFGTGYSSLAYLKQFPIDKLKIDREFVGGLPQDADDAAIARTIVAMGHQLRMQVTAEGVETLEQAQFLRDIGCDELQGYFFGRPAPATEAGRFWSDNSGNGEWGMDQRR